ncbi:hypothetical protein [Amycolatopsis keratiniphila]|uniref:Uncharacterized protein n=1 Tax=Amycolatopsis keratiniphila subsp. keratiniphila TaxID=227715 RepID=A0A1W2LHW9_9PSEU|nr:hypothetical protein [Amycolatopsis keratiniphila]OLZ54111.1 hypothetical protein BS330_21245 [Amycolatopsis keratiniphila subsp. nogabecina]ONF62413.1 hypothetical protein AVR91_0239355 [Amycolatopsis keratiniphila subsp. keratiniphila]SDU64139.1 hypothetical protein SAMN04489733_7524 [Amycolatopsis keratiniphila]
MSQNQSSGTAIGAAVLAFLCGMRYLSEAGTFVGQLAFLGPAPQYFVGMAWNGALTATLIVGGVLLLLRRTLGRTLVVAGTALALVATLLANGAVRAYFFAEVDGETPVTGEVVAFALFVMTFAALVLAVIRPTSDWLEGRRRDDEEPSEQDRLPGW